jgi:GT2 family glycosyltransferase
MDLTYVVIVTFNGIEWVDKCINSVVNSTARTHICVVDNLSADGTVAFIKNNYPQVELIETGENIGFGKANNIGIKHALKSGAGYVFLLNQDAWITPDTINGLIDIHKLNEGYGILSPVHLNGQGSAMDYNFSQACNVPECHGFLSDLYLKKLQDSYPINFVMAALWLMPAETLSKAGLFDPIFHHYGEDHDYVQRVRSLGLKVGICPGFAGFHDRAERQPSAQRDAAIRHSYYLCILKDNNKKLSSAIFQFWMLLISNIFVLARKQMWKLFFGEIAIGFKLLFLFSKIISNRKYTAQVGAFLN